MYPKFYADLFREFPRTLEVFVAMPSKGFEQRWNSIFKPAIRSCKLKPHRVKERFVSDSIPMDIIDAMNRAMFLLFDISNEKTEKPNPNVMYELGIAHATRLPQEVIIVRDNYSKSSPFDVSHIRWNEFFPQKIKRSITKVKKLIKNAKKEIDLTKDLMIEKTLNVLDPEMIEFIGIIKNYYESVEKRCIKHGFDLYPFDPDRKGLYGLITKECSEKYLRGIAKSLINIGILKSAEPLPLRKRIYGGTAEYHLTEMGKVILKKIPKIA